MMLDTNHLAADDDVRPSVEPDTIYGWICGTCFRGAFPGHETCNHKNPQLIAFPIDDGKNGWGGGKS